MILHRIQKTLKRRSPSYTLPMPTTARPSAPAPPVHTPSGPVYAHVLDMIGKTPLLEVRTLDTGPCRLFLKMELANPAGSIKDRIGLTMISAAEQDGRIDPSASAPPTLIEATAGNTGIGLALVAAQRGYKLIVVVPDKMSQGKIRHLRAMGAVVHLTRSDVEKGHPEYYQDVAQRLADETPNSLYINQFANPDNARAHYETTGPEIVEQIHAATGQPLGAFICGVGSGGTLTGVGRALKEADPTTKIILADPAGSILHPLVNEGKETRPSSWLVEGMGEDFVPGVCELDLADKAYPITDRESFDAARELLLAEGVLAGSSTGCLVAAALKFCREQSEPMSVVTLACDQGAKYLDKVFAEPYLLDEDLLSRETHSDLRDLIALRHAQREDVSIKPTDSAHQAFKTLRLHGACALPVIDPAQPDKLLGEFSETAMLEALTTNANAFDAPCSTIMRPAPTIEHSATRAQLAVLLDEHPQVYVTGAVGEYLGLIPRSTLLNRLMRDR